MIRNAIFDVGNVFVRWSPPEVVKRCFDLRIGSDENLQRAEALLRGPVWTRLNLGELTQAEAELAYQIQFGLSKEETKSLFFHVMDHQELIDGTVAIAHRLKRSGYRVFGLTDNVREIVAHLISRSIGDMLNSIRLKGDGAARPQARQDAMTAAAMRLRSSDETAVREAASALL